MTVLYVGTLPPHPGGSAILAAQVLEGLGRRGVRLRALAPAVRDSLGPARRFDAALPAERVERFLVPWFESSPDQDAGRGYREHEAAAVRAGMEALLEDGRPDVVLVGRETFAPAAIEVARRRGAPAVVMIQGATIAGILRRTLPPETAASLTQAFRRADAVIVVARHLVESCRALGLRDVRAIQNGVDLERFSPGEPEPGLRRELGLTENDLVVLHASNLKLLKRPLDIVESAGRALVREPRLAYVMVGDGPLRPAMEEAARAAGVAERFRFPGWVDHERMPAYLRLARAVLMPSESEALALAYLEAMACGRVLVASDIPAAREVVDDGRTGLLFPRGDLDALAAATVAAVDPTIGMEIGGRAREAARGFAMERTVDAYCEVLGEVGAVSRTPSSHGWSDRAGGSKRAPSSS